MLYKTLPLLVLAASAVLAFPTPVANPAPIPLVEPREQTEKPPPLPSEREPSTDPTQLNLPPNPDRDFQGRPYHYPPEEPAEPIPREDRPTRPPLVRGAEFLGTGGPSRGNNVGNNGDRARA